MSWLFFLRKKLSSMLSLDAGVLARPVAVRIPKAYYGGMENTNLRAGTTESRSEADSCELPDLIALLKVRAELLHDEFRFEKAFARDDLASYFDDWVVFCRSFELRLRSKPQQDLRPLSEAMTIVSEMANALRSTVYPTVGDAIFCVARALEALMTVVL